MAYSPKLPSLFVSLDCHRITNRLFVPLSTVIAALVVSLLLSAPGHAARSADTLLFSLSGSHGEADLGFQSPAQHDPLANQAPVELAFADDITSAIVRQLQQGAAQCGRINRVYRIDCLRQVYARAAGAAGNRPDYRGANSELRRLARQLNGIVRQNVDRKAPKKTVGGRSYRAVTQEALRKANRQASQAIQEASTKLLRSAGNSNKRKVHYTRIANAVNSTKKILRS